MNTNTAIVTGAGGGIGLACAKKLAASGYYVIATDLLPASAEWASIANAEYLEGDITDGALRQRLAEYAASKGVLTALVNVAGIAPRVRADLLETGEESFDRVMGVNTKALFFMTQQAAKQMIQGPAQKKYIVNISSMSAYTSSVNRGEYCISKAAVSMTTKLFADRLAEYGITVNEIRPGIIRTPMTQGVQAKYDGLIAGGLLPIKRWGTPEDVANAVAAFTSGQLDYTTGQSIDVDGGFHIQRL